jgi:oxygen-independent coproporphyrinogen-3 oxidase
VHNKEEALKTYEDARKVGFKNISIDLIFATPDQTLQELIEDLDIIEKLSPEHISIYSLIWEEGTKFMEMLEAGKISPVENSLEAEMYEVVIDKLKKIGYTHYEISNFSKPGYQSRHNKKYWKNQEYVGVGLGASGYLENIRYKNKIRFKEYYEDISCGKRPILEKEEVSKKESLENYYILGLRLLEEGIVIKDEAHGKKILELEKKGYLTKEEDRYKLTSRGLMVANDVFLEIIE